MRLILEKMLVADGIIPATPNYINQAIASMKAFFCVGGKAKAESGSEQKRKEFGVRKSDLQVNMML